MSPSIRTAIAVTAVAAGLFMGLLDLSIVTIVIPEIGRALDAQFTELSWVVNAYVLVTAASIIPAGKLGDLIGRKRVFAGGMAMFAIASIACGMAPSAGWLIAFRAAQGIGGAAMVTLSLALISHILPTERRQLGWMIWSATGGLALAAGPSLGGVLTEYASWRWVFIVNAPIALVAFPLVVVTADDARGDASAGTRFDWPGLVTVVGGLSTLSLGLLQGQQWGWDSPRILGLLTAATALLATFAVIETASSAPMVPLRYFRNARFSAACAGWFGAMFAFISVFFFLPVYLEVVREYSVLKASLALSPGPFMAFLFAPASMLAARRFGAGGVALTGILIVAMAVLLTSRVTTGWAYGQLVLLALFTGVGFGAAVPTLTELAMSALDERDAGVGAGVFNTVRQIAAVLALSSLGAALQERMTSSFAGAMTSSTVPDGIRPAVQAEFERRATQRSGFDGAGLPADLGAEIHRLASVALVDGLQVVYVIAGVVCLGALALATVLIARSSEASLAPEPAVIPAAAD